MLACVRLAFRVWNRETCKLLAIGPAALKVTAVMLTATALLMISASVNMFGDLSDIIGQDNTENAQLVIRSLGNGILLSAMTVGGIFGLLSAETSAMDTLLQMVGASRAKRIAVLVTPTTLVALGISWVLNLPIIIAVSAAGRSVGAVMALLLVGLWLVTASTAFGFGLHRWLAHGFTRLVHLPMIHANVAAMAVVLACAVIFGWPALSPGTSAGLPRAFSPGESIERMSMALTEGNLMAMLSVVARVGVLTAAAIALLFAGAGEAADVSKASPTITWPLGRPPRRGTVRLLAWYELVCLGRAPTTLMSALGVGAATAATLVWRTSMAAELFVMLAAVTAGAVGLHATGVNINASWNLRSTVGRTWKLGAAKLLGGLAVVCCLYGTAAVVLIPTVGLSTVVGAFIYFTLPTYIGSLLAGSLLPVNGQQPLTSAAAGALTLFISGGGPLILSRLFSLIGGFGEQLTTPTFILAGASASVAVVSRLQNDSVVQRV